MIFPVIALVLAGLWVADQRLSISTLERASSLLQEHLTAARSASLNTHSKYAKPTATASAATNKKPLDWKEIADQLAEMNQSGGLYDLRLMKRLQQCTQAMSKEELVTALDEISALDLPAVSRDELEQLLIGELVAKDPEFALTHYIDRLHDESSIIKWARLNALNGWMAKDSTKAVTWFDQQIAAGRFDSKSLDGKNRGRNRFEQAVIKVLLGTDPDAASRRLGAIAPDQRVEILGGGYPSLEIKEGDELAFATLVRGQVLEKDQTDVLAKQVSRLVTDDGYAKATGFLDRIAATPIERLACARQAAEIRIESISHNRKITREDLDSMREWTKTQAPNSTDNITGKAIGVALRYGRGTLDFAAASELVFHYHAASGNDDVITAFLSSDAYPDHKEQALALAAQITDPKRREEILKNLQ
jgi:hypothetical protein